MVEADQEVSGLTSMGPLRNPEEIRQYIRDIYSKNPFMADYFHVHIDEIHCGSVTVSLKTDPAKHNNHTGRLHGGVLVALADSVTGVTSASVGASVVTVSMTTNFIRTAEPGERIRVTSRITHHGRKTIVIAADMYDEEDCLMMNVLATMMIMKTFPEIPSHWEG